MPLYDYKCGGGRGCGHTFEGFAHVSDLKATRTCPHCGRRGARRLPAFLAGAKDAPKPERTWGEQEGRSTGLVFDPRGIKDLKKEVPSIELDAQGHAVFRSDRHQRQVYREIDQAREGYRREAQERAEQAAEEGRLEEAKAAADLAAQFEIGA